MIFDLKPYPAMKDSSVEWLGEVAEALECSAIETCMLKVRALWREFSRYSLPRNGEFASCVRRTSQMMDS